MQRYPGDTRADIEDFRRSNWKVAIGSSSRGGYPEMWQALSAAARTATDIGTFAEGKVLWLLADACSMMLNPRSVNEPFKPFMVARSGRSALPQDFQESEIELLAQISEEASDVWVPRRLADLAWILKKPRSLRYALSAIDAYRTIPLDIETWLRGGRECWERAISLCRILRAGAGQRLKDIEAAIVTAFEGTTKSDGFLSLWLSDLLGTNGLGKDKGLFIADKLASLASLFEEEGDLAQARSFFGASAKWFKRAGHKERFMEVTMCVAEAWAREAMARTASAQPSNAVAASFYENAIQEYRTIPRSERAVHGVHDRILELHRLMSEAGERSLREMGRIESGPIDISDVVEQARDAVKGKSAIDALAALANIQPSFSVKRRRMRCEETLKAFPLRSLFSSTHLSSDGRVIAKRPGMGPNDTNSEEYQGVVWSEMVKDYEMELGLIVQGRVWPALEAMILDHRLREGDFVEIARQSPIVPAGRETLFGKALFFGYEREFAAALHLLVPQIEHMVRWHLKAAGAKTTNLDEHGIENENGLSALVDLPKTPAVFGEDLAFELEALFCDAFGPNLRNELAHGLLSYGACESAHSIYAWWLGLHLVFNTFWNAARGANAEKEDQRPEAAEPGGCGQPVPTRPESPGTVPER